MNHPAMIDSEKAGRGQRVSLVNALLALDPGEEISLVSYVDPTAMHADEEQLSKCKSELTAKITKAVSRAKEKINGISFETESAIVPTSRNRIYALVIVTRTQ